MIKRDSSTGRSAGTIHTASAAGARQASEVSQGVIVPKTSRLVLQVSAPNPGYANLSWSCGKVEDFPASAVDKYVPSLSEAAKTKPDLVISTEIRVVDDGTVSGSTMKAQRPASLEAAPIGHEFHQVPFAVDLSTSACKPGYLLSVLGTRTDLKPFTLTLLGSR